MSLEVEFHHSLTPDQEAEWTRFWATCQHSHPRQHVVFGQVERAKGRTPIFVMVREGASLVLVGLFSIRPHWWLGGASLEAVCQRGPLFDDPGILEAVLPSVLAYCERSHVGRLWVSPRVPAGASAATIAVLHGLRFHSRPVDACLQKTGLIDLTPSEDELLMSFSKSTRRDIRSAERGGVVVRPILAESDMRRFLCFLVHLHRRRGLGCRMISDVAALSEYVVRRDGLGILLGCYHGCDLLGGLLILRSPRCAHASRYALAPELPDELANIRLGAQLWWEAIKWAKRCGCTSFDVEGFDPSTDAASPVFRVHHFKAGFRPQPAQFIGEHVRVLNYMLCAVNDSVKTLERAVDLAVESWRRAIRRCVLPSMSDEPALREPVATRACHS